MALKKGSKKKTAAAKPRAKKAAVKKAAGKTVMKKAGSASRKPAAKKVLKKAVKKTVITRVSSGESSPRPRISAGNQKRHEALKKILFKKRGEVVSGLEAQMGRKLTRETGQRIDAAMDSGDMSSQDIDQGIDYSLLEMKYEQYKDIADAFRKLQNNTFGLCEECGEEIDIKRMEVNPLARYCIACKTKKEEIERIQKEETRFKE
jgi:DnaK suppressor protein